MNRPAVPTGAVADSAGSIGVPAIGMQASLLATRDLMHLSMCDGEGDAMPPLGWVLSEAMCKQFPGILDKQCGNPDEFR
jgi:hypothetical protein